MNHQCLALRSCQILTDPKSPKWLCGTSSAKKVVNIKKIAAYSKEGDSVLVPGKVLGIGSIPHKITLYSFSISESAAMLITKVGGSVKPIDDAVKDHPTGKGLIMLG